MTPEQQFERILESRKRQQGRILGIDHPTLRLFAHDRQGNLCLRAAVPEDFKLRRMVSTRGIEVDADTRLSTDRELSFVSRAPAMDSVFLSFVHFAVQRTLPAVDESAALEKLVDAYEDFRRYMESERGLSSEALKGLVAELVVMLWLVGRGFEPGSVLMAWKGPFKDNKDFVLADGRAFEVKSAPYNGTSVRISSPDQLEPNGLDLSLCVVHMEPGAEGMEGAVSLNTLHQRLSAVFNASGVDPAALDVGMEAYGLRPDDDRSREVWFVCRDPFEYTVREDFPRVRRASIPVGVSGVNFLVDLKAVEHFRLEEGLDSDGNEDVA